MTTADLGTSDKLISGKFQESYFIQKYSKTTHCSSQVIPLQFNDQINFGEEQTIDIYQEGDILNMLYLEFAYPLGQPTAVCDSFGTYMLNWVQLEYGNQVIERIDGEYLEIINDTTVPQSKQGTLSNLTGKYLTSNLATYYINLPFSILKTGLPVCALGENVILRINLRNFWEGCPTASRVNPVFNATIRCTYLFLEEKEKKFFSSKKLTYLYEQTQRVDVDAGYANSISIFSGLQNPTSELFIVIKDASANAYVWNNTLTGGDQLASMRMVLNMTEFITYDIGTPLFLRALQALEAHTRCPDRYFYMYSFCLDPENSSSTGSLNMSTVKQQFDINMTSSNKARLISLYSKSYNLLEIQDGKLVVKYPVPFQTSGYIQNTLKTVPFILNNPGNITLLSNVLGYTASSATYTFQLTNITGALIPSWSYPLLNGITWTPSNSSLRLVAAPGTSFINQRVYVTAGYGTGITFLLTVDNSTLFTLQNPGATTLYTVTSNPLSSKTLTLINPYSLTPTWVYPTISGVSWSTTNTSITMTAAQGTSLNSTSVTVSANYGSISYPQTFYLFINNSPDFILSNPQVIYLATPTSTASKIISLINPVGVTVAWTYPTLTGVTWTPSNTGITMTAAQGTTLATQNITITAAYGAFSYPQTMSLTISTNILQNPGTTTLYTLKDTSLSLVLSNPSSFPVTWSYPPLTGVTWSTSLTGITLVPVIGLYMASTSITVTATYNGTPYTSVFNLTITNSFTFTNMNGSTSTAPTTITYSTYPYPDSLVLKSGYQFWTVPATGLYNFTVAGAGGTSGNGETGAVLRASYILNSGTILGMCIGQQNSTAGFGYGYRGAGGTFITYVPTSNVVSLTDAVPLFVAGGSGGVGANDVSATISIVSATLSNRGIDGAVYLYPRFFGGIGGIGPASGTSGTSSIPGMTGGGGFTSFKLNQPAGGSWGGGGNSTGNTPNGGGGGGWGGGGSGGGNRGYNAGGGGSYDVTRVYSGSINNAGQGYCTIDTSLRFTLSNVISIFLFTSTSGSSTLIPLTYTNPNPYSLLPTYTSTTLSGITLTSPSLNGVQITAAQGTVQTLADFVLTAAYGLYSYPISIKVSCGSDIGFYIAPATRIFYTAYNSSYTNIALTNTYNLPVSWYITPSLPYSKTTSTSGNTRIEYSGGPFATQVMTVQITTGSTIYTQTFNIQTVSTKLTLVPCANSYGNSINVPSIQYLSGVYAYNTTDSYYSFDTRGTIAPGAAVPTLYSTSVIAGTAGDTITVIMNIVAITQTNNYKSIWIHDGTGWNYNPIAVQTNQPITTGTNYTYTFTIPSTLPGGLYTIAFMSSYGGLYSPNVTDIRRTCLEYVLQVNDYTGGYALSNPGTQILNTIGSQQQFVLTLTNPDNAIPTWSYPTIAGVTWTASTSSPWTITATAAQGTEYATNTITVQVSVPSRFIMKQSFSLTLINNPQYVLSNPGTTNLVTLTGPQTVTLTLTNPYNLTPSWTYPTIAGVTWAPSNTGITLTAAQGSSYATNPITVQASYSTFNYPQTFSLTINSNPGFVLSNPGPTTLYTIASSQPLTLTLTNPSNLTPSWTYPTIAGVTWAPSNTGITLTAAQGTSYATNSITVQASYSTYNYPQTFSLTINNVIVNFTGKVSTLASGLTGSPFGVACDQSTPPNIYIANYSLNNVVKLDATTGAGTQVSTGLNFPQGIAIDNAGNIYVADTNNNTIKKVIASTGVTSTIGTGIVGPRSVTCDNSGNIYVVDDSNTVKKIIAGTGVTSTLATGFAQPKGITCDLAGNIYVADTTNNVVKKVIASTGATSTLATGFNSPYGVTCDNSGNVYVSDSGSNQIKKIIASTGVVSVLAGSGSAGSADGTGTAASFSTPYGLVITRNGALMYIADLGNSSIRKVT